MKNQNNFPDTREAKSIPLDAKPLLTLKEASIYNRYRDQQAKRNVQ